MSLTVPAVTVIVLEPFGIVQDVFKPSGSRNGPFDSNHLQLIVTRATTGAGVAVSVNDTSSPSATELRSAAIVNYRELGRTR